MTPVVDITTTGRGGGISYREGAHTIEFSWEFAMSPALALVWGPAQAEWDTQYAWARGRQQAIFEFVGQEVVRQKASDGGFEYDLELGHLTILNSTGARKQGHAAARAAAANDELRQHLSVDARLERAEAQLADGQLSDLDDTLAREIRRLSRVEDGLERALRLAAGHPTDRVRSALLFASANATPCAPRCAETLLTLTKGAPKAESPAMQSLLGHLGLHVSHFERSQAVDQLVAIVGLKVETED